MKRLFLITCICFTVQLTLGQTVQGTYFSGLSTGFQLGNELIYPLGGISFGTSKLKSDDPDQESDGTDFIRLNLRPRVGVFIVNNLAAGLDFNWGYASDEFGDGDFKIIQSAVLTGPFLRYYFPLKRSKFFIEGVGTWGNAKIKFTDDIDSEEEKNSLSRWAASLGFSFPLVEKRLTFDVQTGYETIQIKPVEDNPDNFRSVQNSMYLQLGLTFFINKPE